MGRYDLRANQVMIKDKRRRNAYPLSAHSGYIGMLLGRNKIGEDISADGKPMYSYDEYVKVKIEMDDSVDFQRWLNENTCDNYVIEMVVDNINGIDEIEISHPQCQGEGIWEARADKNCIPPTLYL